MEIREVLITGSSGLIGSCLAGLLASKGMVVNAQTRGGKKAQERICWWAKKYSGSTCEENLRIIEADIWDAGAYASAIKSSDAVFHLAGRVNVQQALSDPLESHKANVEATICLLEVLKKSGFGKKLVFCSTANVYGKPLYLPVDELHPLFPQEPYAASKAAAEMYCTAYSKSCGFGLATARASHVYGPWQDGTQLIPKIAKKVLGGQEVILTKGSSVREFLYVEDAASGLEAAARFGSGVYNLSTGKQTEINKLIGEMIQKLKPGYGNMKIVDSFRSDDFEKLQIDCGKARRELGWKAEYEIGQGLEKTLGWILGQEG
ncbi:NAD-dependent epimerase/dehydratase family protein [Candidatus Parvarchaeota archaeon]|nr:NAD-dependent epimerase/dehydratase family protein [Candidatus Parvarchaeota archaeon]